MSLAGMYAKAAEWGASERSIDAELRSIFLRADKAKREQKKPFCYGETRIAMTGPGA
jgi:hypothetical protein